MIAAFWVSVVMVLYPYVLYPALLVCINRVRAGTQPKKTAGDKYSPTVSILVPVHNEATRIAAKVRNLLELDYVPGKLQLLVIGDGCSDDTLQRASETGGSRIEVIALPQRAGKAAALNAGMNRSSGEIIVFTDAAIVLDRDALRNLMARFADPAIGCVSGEDYVANSVSSGEGLYGRMELLLRREESKLHSIAGASGCFYGQRKQICKEFLPGMAPDFLSVLVTVAAGYRAVSESRARGSMTATSSQKAELTRKTRTFLRGITTLFANLSLLNPFRNPAMSFILVSHKLMRWLGPIALITCLLLSWTLRSDPLYELLFVIQALFYAVALLAIVAPLIARHSALARISAFFLMVNVAALCAALQWLAGVRQELWQPTHRSR